MSNTTIEQTETEAPDFHCELGYLLNRHSMENGSDTPDFILRDFLCDVLSAFDKAVRRRETWGEEKEVEGDHE